MGYNGMKWDAIGMEWDAIGIEWDAMGVEWDATGRQWARPRPGGGKALDVGVPNSLRSPAGGRRKRSRQNEHRATGGWLGSGRTEK